MRGQPSPKQGKTQRRAAAVVLAVVALWGLESPWWGGGSEALAQSGAPVASSGTAKTMGGFVGVQIQAADAVLRTAVLPSREGVAGKEAALGVFIRDLASGSPAEKAGLRRGDLVTEVEGVPVTSLPQVVAAMQATRPLQSLSVVRWRRGEKQVVRLSLAPWPEGWVVEQASLAIVPRLGVTVAALTETQRAGAGVPWGVRGVLVQSIEAGSLGQKSGLQAGDVIQRVGTVALTAPAALEEAFAAAGPEGATWWMQVLRGRKVVLIGPGVRRVPWVSGGLLLATVAEGAGGTGAGGTGAGRDATRVFAVDPSLPEARPEAAALVPGDALTADQARMFAHETPRPAPHQAVLESFGMTVSSLSSELRGRYDLPWNSSGAVVTAVQPRSRAQRAGLVPGMVIAAINQQEMTSEEAVRGELARLEAAPPVGAQAMLTVIGGAGSVLLALPLAEDGKGGGAGSGAGSSSGVGSGAGSGEGSGGFQFVVPTAKAN